MRVGVPVAMLVVMGAPGVRGRGRGRGTARGIGLGLGLGLGLDGHGCT